MNRPISRLHRLPGLAAAMFAVSIGAVAFAAGPASAHEPTIDTTVTCGAETVERGDGCEGDESAEPRPAEATVSAISDCDSFTITATNPEDGAETATVILVSNSGDPHELIVPRGESVSKVWPAAEGLMIDAFLGEIPENAKSDGRFAYEPPSAAECETEQTPGEGGGDGEELPLTGADAGMIAGGAVVLLAIGVVVLLVVRRRRVSFTA